MRGNGEVIAEPHHRPALPSGALVAAREQTVVAGSYPHVAGDIECVDETFKLNNRCLNLLFYVDLSAAVNLRRSLKQRVCNGIARLPDECAC